LFDFAINDFVLGDFTIRNGKMGDRARAGVGERSGECGADVTLVPNLLSFRADTDFPQITISVA
jgi:hypothetical protein